MSDTSMIRYHARRARGLCPRCGRSRESAYVHCEPCRAKLRPRALPPTLAPLPSEPLARRAVVYEHQLFEVAFPAVGAASGVIGGSLLVPCRDDERYYLTRQHPLVLPETL